MLAEEGLSSIMNVALVNYNAQKLHNWITHIFYRVCVLYMRNTIYL